MAEFVHGKAGRRRAVSAIFMLAAAAVPVIASLPAPAAPVPAAVSPLEQVKEDLVAANRVLYAEGVLDGNGHVSARSPINPDHLLISRALPPGLVTARDIVELDTDCNIVDGYAKDVKLYSESFLHCAVYKARADINAVVHSHSPGSVAFSVTGIPMRPILHTAAFLNEKGPPVYDPSKETEAGAMLIRTSRLGAALAKKLGDQDVLLIRGHGNVVTGKNIPIMVMRAIISETNALTLLKLLPLHADIAYLSADDIRSQRKAEDEDKQWRSWLIYKQEDKDGVRRSSYIR